MAAGRLRGRSQLQPAPAAEPGAVPVHRRRGTGGDAGRCAVVPGVRRSDAAGDNPRRGRQQPRSPGGDGASRGGARPRGYRQVVPLSASRRRRELRRPPGVECDDQRERGRRHDASEWDLRFSAVLGARSVRPPAARAGSGVCIGPGERAGAPRRARHADRRRRDELFPAARARPPARDRSRHAPHQRRHGELLPQPAGRRRVEPARARSHPGQPRAHRDGHSAARGGDRHRRERDRAAARPAAGIDHAAGAQDGRSAAAGDPRRASRVAARAAARRRAGGAVAGRGQRGYRRRQGAVLPDHQPDRFSRRRQRRPDEVPRRRRGGLVGRHLAAAADLPGRAAPPQSRSHAGALRCRARRIPEVGAQRLP